MLMGIYVNGHRRYIFKTQYVKWLMLDHEAWTQDDVIRRYILFQTAEGAKSSDYSQLNHAYLIA